MWRSDPLCFEFSFLFSFYIKNSKLSFIGVYASLNPKEVRPSALFYFESCIKQGGIKNRIKI